MAYKQSEAVHLPIWIIGLLVTLFFATASVVFTAGQTYNAIAEVHQHIERIEQRLNEIDRELREWQKH